jgi:hypothetical protein
MENKEKELQNSRNRRDINRANRQLEDKFQAEGLKGAIKVNNRISDPVAKLNSTLKQVLEMYTTQFKNIKKWWTSIPIEMLPNYEKTVGGPANVETLDSLRTKLDNNTYDFHLFFASLCLFDSNSFFWVCSFQTAAAFLKRIELMVKNSEKFNGFDNEITKDAMHMLSHVRQRLEMVSSLFFLCLFYPNTSFPSLFSSLKIRRRLRFMSDRSNSNTCIRILFSNYGIMKNTKIIDYQSIQR